ncbi:hypothetical protein F5141DRAFT_1122332 [Pisolithus sp. B1]|nr:hypothetical protein F5141DRAFT_1122332 [Pisolithus sp. B1]
MAGGCGVSSGAQWEYPPYCHLGWDQGADALEGTAATDVAQAGHIIGYRRPLWKSMRELHDVYGTIKVVTSKLRGSSSENRKVPLVTLSRRFCLELALGHPETNKFVASAMTSHLCVLLSMTDDRHWNFTTEPFVWCAAAALIHSSDKLDRLLRALEEKIVSGMIIVGRSGGLASRLLWLFAKDLYVRCTLPYKFILPATNGKDWESELVDCRMIPVVDYFRFVFGKDFWAKVEGGKDAEEVFKDAYINFSHWVSMGEYICSSKNGDEQLAADEWTLRQWHRTCAVQCCYGQPPVDKMIPVYFKDCPGQTDLSRVSQIFIIDRAQRSTETHDLQKIAPTMGCDLGRFGRERTCSGIDLPR